MNEASPGNVPQEENRESHVSAEDNQGEVVSIPVDDINPLAPNVNGTNYVDDKDKAEAMAYAETDFRTKAVENRAAAHGRPKELAESIEEVREEAKEVHDEGQHLSLWPPKRKAQNQRYREVYGRYDELLDEEAADRSRRHEANLTTSRQFREDFDRHADGGGGIFYPFATRSTSSPEERASFYDWYAERIGKWAAALHENPLSAEFKKSHPGVQFQPKRLVRMEDEVTMLENEIEFDQDIPHTNAETEMLSLIRGTGKIQRLLDRVGDEEKQKEYDQIIEELEERASKLDALEGRLFSEAEVKPLQQKATSLHNLLNDVRREVGLPIEEEEAAEKEQAEPQTEAESEA